MIDLTLTEIAAAIDGRLIPGSADPGFVVSGVADTDSRLITPGDIFVAKPGEETDGHLFADAAVANGAALLIVERELAVAVPQVVVEDSVTALGALATEVITRVRALGRLRIVGITGSNGKTTTKNLLAAVLERVGDTVSPKASFNNEVGAPITMLRVTSETRFLVAEMGASGIGEIARLIRMAKPDIGVVLKVGLAHAGSSVGSERPSRRRPRWCPSCSRRTSPSSTSTIHGWPVWPMPPGHVCSGSASTTAPPFGRPTSSRRRPEPRSRCTCPTVPLRASGSRCSVSTTS